MFRHISCKIIEPNCVNSQFLKTSLRAALTVSGTNYLELEWDTFCSGKGFSAVAYSTPMRERRAKEGKKNTHEYIRQAHTAQPQRVTPHQQPHTSNEKQAVQNTFNHYNEVVDKVNTAPPPSNEGITTRNCVHVRRTQRTRGTRRARHHHGPRRQTASGVSVSESSRPC